LIVDRPTRPRPATNRWRHVSAIYPTRKNFCFAGFYEAQGVAEPFQKMIVLANFPALLVNLVKQREEQ